MRLKVYAPYHYFNVALSVQSIPCGLSRSVVLRQPIACFKQTAIEQTIQSCVRFDRYFSSPNNRILLRMPPRVWIYLLRTSALSSLLLLATYIKSIALNIIFTASPQTPYLTDLEMSFCRFNISLATSKVFLYNCKFSVTMYHQCTSTA